MRAASVARRKQPLGAPAPRAPHSGTLAPKPKAVPPAKAGAKAGAKGKAAEAAAPAPEPEPEPEAPPPPPPRSPSPPPPEPEVDHGPDGPDTLSLTLPLPAAAAGVAHESYWRRRCEARCAPKWLACDPAAHGGSWKALFFERHVAELLGAAEGDAAAAPLDDAALRWELALAAPFVRQLALRPRAPGVVNYALMCEVLGRRVCAKCASAVRASVRALERKRRKAEALNCALRARRVDRPRAPRPRPAARSRR